MEDYVKLIGTRNLQYMNQRETAVRKKLSMEKTECKTIQKKMRHIIKFQNIGLTYLNHFLSKRHISFV